MFVGRPKWQVNVVYHLLKLDFVVFLPVISTNSGKTAMSATVGIGSDFPYVKIVSGFQYHVKTIIFLAYLLLFHGCFYKYFFL